MYQFILNQIMCQDIQKLLSEASSVQPLVQQELRCLRSSYEFWWKNFKQKKKTIQTKWLCDIINLSPPPAILIIHSSAHVK